MSVKTNNMLCDYTIDKHKAESFFSQISLSSTKTCVYLTMLAAIAVVFFNQNTQIVVGPVMACCFIYLFLNGYQPLVTAIIIVANDALGCIFFGKISFPYLLLLLFVVSMIIQKTPLRIHVSQAIAGCILLFMLSFLCFNQIISIKSFIYSLTFIISAGKCVTSDEKRDMFFKGVAITVCLISIHTVFTGGVEYYELNEYSTAFLRKGILGVGIGDSNISSFLLNIGIAIALFDASFRWYTKFCMISFGVGAMAVTLSTTGIIGCILVVSCYVFIRRSSIPSKIWKALMAIIAILLVFSIYTSLPSEMKNETVDAYISRVSDKIDFLKVGDMATFTTNRSGIFDDTVNYIFKEQSISKLLFGLNAKQAHNTYLDLILQIGMVGFVAAMMFILKKLIVSFKNKRESRIDVVLKLVVLYYAVTLSLYQGSLYALSYVILIVI